MALERVLIRPVADVRELDPAADTAELATIDYLGAIAIGGTVATSVDIGKVGILTKILGNLQVDGTTTLVDTMTAQGDVNLGDGADTINIGGGIGTDTINLRDDLNVFAGILIDLKTAGGYISLPTDAQAPAVDGTDGYLRINTTLSPDTLQWLDLEGAGTWMTVAFLGGVTLDFAYDGGGAGAGRIITCDSGAVEIVGSNVADYALEVTNSAAGGALFVNNTGVGFTIDFQDGGGNVFSIADGGAFDLDAAAFDLNATGNITIDTSAGVIDIDATGVVDIDSSAGAIGIGTNPVAQNINIGTGNSARIISLGHAVSTEVEINALLIDLNAGATGMTLDSVGPLTITNTGVGGVYISSTGKEVVIDADQEIEINSAAGPIKIGHDAVAQAINIGTGASARTIIVGNVASTEVEINALLIDLNAGATGMTLDSVGPLTITNTGVGGVYISSTGKEVVIDADQEIEINSAAGPIKIGHDNVAQSISIGTLGARAIFIGNAAALSVNLDAIAISIDASDDSNFKVSGVAKHLTLEVAGGGAQVLAINSAGNGVNALDLNATGGGITADAAAGISLDAVDTSNFTMSGGGDGARLTIETQGAGNQGIVISSAGNIATAIDVNATAGGIEIDALLDIAINSSTGSILIGDDAVAKPINIGTGNAARVITIGHAGFASTEVEITAIRVDINADSNGVQIDSAAGISIDAHSVSNYSVNGSGQHLTLECFGGGLQKLNIGSAGTGVDAIDITASAGGIEIDAVKASHFIVSGATADLTFNARGGTAITLNEAGETALHAGFTATSIIGALNELADEDFLDPVTTVNVAAYTALITDMVLFVTYTDTGVCTITLTSVEIAKSGRKFIIKDAGLNASVNNIIVNTQGAETIEEQANMTIAVDGTSITLHSDGSNLYVT